MLLVLTFFYAAGFAQEKVSTASSNVQIVDKVFEIPGLNRIRKIRVYLPPSYGTTDELYPVLYMHDAQNLFDEATSYAGEWGVDEVLNEIAAEGGPEIIVVGIDNNGETRMTEYSAWDNMRFGKSEGEEYVDFIVNVILPYVNNNYRSKAGIRWTGIGGSSMGGLISHYAIYQYPEVFGKAGIYSPSYWYAYEQVFDFTKSNPLSKEHKLDFLVGKKEGQMMVGPMEQMVDLIKESGLPADHIRSHVIEDGEHNERFWRSEFKATILWLFNNN